MRVRSVVWVMLALILGEWSTAAGVPQLMNYQGILLDGTGTAITTPTNVLFAIWDADVAGDSLWSEVQTVTPDAEGRFMVLLGSVSLIPNSAFAGDAYLSLKADSDPEMTPRLRIASVGYAYRVATVDGATGGTISGDVAIQSDLDVDGDIRVTGQATIGPGHTSTGTFVLLAGQNNTSTANNTVVLGTSTTASADHATVGGGEFNIASGRHSVVCGGGGGSVNDLNDAGGDYSCVGGGRVNAANGNQATIGGGDNNQATGRNAVVSGGSGNVAGSGDYSTVGGGEGNSSSGLNATISGGKGNAATGWNAVVSGGGVNTASGREATVSGGRSNSASADYATVGGGIFNTAGAVLSTIAGGTENVTLASDGNSTVSGGRGNIAGGKSTTVAGGDYNRARGNYSVVCGGGGHTPTDSNLAQGTWSAIGGGLQNIVGGYSSVVSGGSGNTAEGSFGAIGGGTLNNTGAGQSATIPGGANNEATGAYSFAAGYHAGAWGDGTFVWADASSATTYGTSVPNRFGARAHGGVYFTTGASAGVYLASGASSWTALCDSTLKRNIRDVDCQEILAKVAALPVSQWSYKSQDASIEHIGPMAQDFYRLFGLGEDDKHINTLDPDGVALAAIKALYLENVGQSAKVDRLEAQLAELQAEMQALRAQQR